MIHKYYKYNAKIIQYANHTTQIRLYQNVIESEKNKSEHKVMKKNFLNDTKNRFEDKEESRRSSLARTRRVISDYAKSANWEWFVTLTFDPRKVNDRSDFTECMQKVRFWLNNQRKRFATDLQYLAVPELHKDLMNWHIHILVARTGQMKFTESGHRTRKGQIIYNLSNWKFGFSTATKIEDTKRCAIYILKYITKESNLIAFNKNRYYVSKNLQKPQVDFLLIQKNEQEEFISQMKDSLGLDETYRYETDKNSFNPTLYVDLQ
jgi:hypothetical protein